MTKHFSEYTRADIIKCLHVAGLKVTRNGFPIEKVTTKILAVWLNDAIREGDAPSLEDLEDSD